MYMRNAPISPTGRRLLSRTAEHALRAALYLGRQEKAGLVSAAEIARALRTAVSRCARAGPSSPSPTSWTPWTSRPTACSETGPATRRIRAAHRRWLEVQAHTIELLERTTLADLLNGDGASHYPRS
jgi:DNA-binding IscR family transcriptional regulator